MIIKIPFLPDEGKKSTLAMPEDNLAELPTPSDSGTQISGYNETILQKKVKNHTKEISIEIPRVETTLPK